MNLPKKHMLQFIQVFNIFIVLQSIFLGNKFLIYVKFKANF